MTRPIYEPSTQRQIRGQGFTGDQLLRRPAPISDAGATSSAILDTWVANGTGASIADDTWSAVVTGVNGTNDRWFDQSCVDPTGDWGITFANGEISNSAAVAYNYAAWGFVVFDVPDGTLIGCEINWFGAEVQTNTSVAVDGVSRVGCYAERTPIPAGGVRLYCYQASGAPADLLEARLHVRRFEIYEDVYDCQFAT